MNNDEAKTALFRRTPVTYNGIEYLCITAITYRVNTNGELIISAELLDKNRRSVTIAQLKDVITL
jgi:hypothetical protein